MTDEENGIPEAHEPGVDVGTPMSDEPVPYETPNAAPAPHRTVTPRRSIFVARLIQAIWLGSGVFFMFLAAPAAFRSAGSASTAADVVGAMLMRWHYIALIAPALLILIEWHRVRPRVVTLLFVAIVAAALQAGVDVRIRTIRMASPMAISSLPNRDPLRRQFGILHGISSVLLLAQLVTAIGTIAVEPDPE